MAESELGRAQARALRLLTARGRSEAELRERLTRAGFDEDIAEDTVAWCLRLGYLDDARFAADWVEYRTLHAPSGRRRLQLELREKGVDSDVILQTLEDHLPRQLERKLCVEAALGRARRYATTEPTARARRLTSFLQRRGFNFDDIRHALAQVDTISDTD